MSGPVTIIVPGEPVAWARARPSFGRPGEFITPQKQRRYLEIARFQAVLAMAGCAPFDCALRMDLESQFPIPVSWSKDKKRAALLGVIRPTKTPDIINIAKIIEDAFNGVLYRDDALIVEYGTLRKVYSNSPKLVVTVTPIAIAAEHRPKRTARAELESICADLPNDVLDDMIDAGAGQ